MKDIAYAIIFSLACCFCYAESDIDTSYELDTELNILADLLAQQGYQPPTQSKFKEKCIQYFNVDTDLVRNNYYVGVGGDGYVLSINKKFLSTYYESILYNPNTLGSNFTLNQVKSKLKDNPLSERMFFYNKLLFLDDNSDETTTYFVNHPDELIEVIVWFDYEKNNLLFSQVSQYINTDGLYHPTSIIHYLFYNNPVRGYKKKLLNEIYTTKGITPIIQITKAYYNAWNKLNINKKYGNLEITQKNKEDVLQHLIGLIIQHKDLSTNIDYSTLGANYFSNFVDLDNTLLERIKLPY